MNDEMQKKQDEGDEAPIADLRRLARSVEPSRDLWPGIESRLVPRRRRVSANGWMSLAAAACVMVIVGLAVVPSPQAPATSASVTAVQDDMFAAPNLRAVAGSRALVKANLQLSRNSEAQIRHALTQDPDSQSLRRLLLTTQSRSDELHHMLLAQAT